MMGGAGGWVLKMGTGTSWVRRDPLLLARSLQQAKVSMAMVYFSSDITVAHRHLYCQPAEYWNSGHRILFDMAAKVAGVMRPIPVLTSVGWQAPSAGEVA